MRDRFIWEHKKDFMLDLRLRYFLFFCFIKILFLMEISTSSFHHEISFSFSQTLGQETQRVLETHAEEKHFTPADYRLMAHTIGDLHKRDKSLVSILEENSKRLISLSPLVFGSISTVGFTLGIGSLCTVGVPGLIVAGSAVSLLAIIKAIRHHYASSYYEMAGVLEHAAGVKNVRKPRKNKKNAKRFEAFFQTLIHHREATGIVSYPQIQVLLQDMNQKGLLKDYPLPEVISEMMNTGLMTLAVKSVIPNEKLVTIHEIVKNILEELGEDLTPLIGKQKNQKSNLNFDEPKNRTLRSELLGKYYQLLTIFLNKKLENDDFKKMTDDFLSHSIIRRSSHPSLSLMKEYFSLNRKDLEKNLSNKKIKWGQEVFSIAQVEERIRSIMSSYEKKGESFTREVLSEESHHKKSRPRILAVQSTRENILDSGKQFLSPRSSRKER